MSARSWSRPASAFISSRASRDTTRSERPSATRSTERCQIGSSGPIASSGAAPLFAAGRGETVAIVGESGAGKSTVFNLLVRLYDVARGSILIDGHDVTHLPMYQRARIGVGYLPQEASIFRGMTVEQNIMAVLELVEPRKKKRKEQLDSLLEEFKITRLRRSPSLALSGGERRRCEIARALASRPSFMLLDEPFAGIDPLAVGDIQDLVRHLTQRGIGVLITDHNVRETLDLIDRAYIIYDGRVLTHGNPQEIKANPDVRRVYLGDMFD